MWETTIGDGTKTWARLRAGHVVGRSKIAPVLAFDVYARTPRERMRCQLHVIRGELLAGVERLGEGTSTGIELQNAEYSFTLEIPVGRAALDYLDTIASGDHIQLVLRLTGWVRACDDNEDAGRFASQPSAGEWVFEAFGAGRQTELTFAVARSEWFARVLQPIGTTEYVSTELLLPLGDASMRQSVERLCEADRAFALGDDPTVFARCRAALDALPGAPKSIFVGLSDADEQKELDDLVGAAGRYFHRGRHVARGGTPRAGDFPVDHGDARFALNLIKVIVAHVSKVLSR